MVLARPIVVLGRLILVASLTCGAAVAAQESVEWRHYAADRASTKYSPAAQIDASNISELEVAWRWVTPDGNVEAPALAGELKGTPLMVNGTLYAVSALNLVSAINPETGEELWTYDPLAYERGTPTHGGFTQRGIEFWEHRGMQRIVLVTGTHQLVSLDARTGKPDLEFGEAGMVDMRGDIGRRARWARPARARPESSAATPFSWA